MGRMPSHGKVSFWCSFGATKSSNRAKGIGVELRIACQELID